MLVSGWQTFIKRRTAVAKINSLPDATSVDLATLDDVCAICYQEMTSAKITRCRHFFHAVSSHCLVPFCKNVIVVVYWVMTVLSDEIANYQAS